MPLLGAVALLAGASIAYEILLTRLFAIVLWHHFAYMIISVALLGIGASGTFLVFVQRRLAPHLGTALAVAAAAFGLSAVACFALAQRVPFNPLQIIWDPAQQLYLAEIYLLLAVPFFAAGAGIGLALTGRPERIGAVYRADLVGAGAGVVLLVGLLFLLRPQDALRVVGALGLLAAALAVWGDGPRRRGIAAALALAAIGAAWVWPAAWLDPRPSQFKGLSVALTYPEATVVDERSSPLGLLTTVESPAIPFRHAPGLSLTAPTEPPPQLGVYTNADSLTPITRFAGDLAALDYLGQQTAALPYAVLDDPRTLILGAGGGADVLRALARGVTRIDAVELNGQLVDLVREEFADFAGRLYDRPEVALHIAEARSFVEASDERWDLIQVALLDSFTAAAAGVQALSESTLYTVEALEAYHGHLAPGGLLAITRWLQVPPRDPVKLLATAVAALEARGVADPGRQLALIHEWNTATLLVKNGPFTPDEIEAIRAFAEARAFDVAWYPGMPRDLANRYNQFEQPYLYDAATALLGPGREAFLDAYKFNVRPAIDDRPYYFHFFKWRLLPEMIALRGQGGLTLLDTGYLILIGTLAQAAVASLVLILLPLFALGRPRDRAIGLARWRVAVYFLALGLGFIFVEIAFIQRFTLFLGHPLTAIAVVLAAFLVFAGLGAGLSGRLAARRPRAAISLAVLGIVVVAAAYLAALPLVFPALMALPLWLKIVLAVVLVAPLALAMGLPFPLGLAAVAKRAPDLAPWAWAINGCASVIGAVLASVLAMHVGFTAVVAVALALYALAAASFARLSAERRPTAAHTRVTPHGLPAQGA